MEIEYTFLYRIKIYLWMRNRRISTPYCLLQEGSAERIWNYL